MTDPTHGYHLALFFFFIFWALAVLIIFHFAGLGWGIVVLLCIFAYRICLNVLGSGS